MPRKKKDEQEEKKPAAKKAATKKKTATSKAKKTTTGTRKKPAAKKKTTSRSKKSQKREPVVAEGTYCFYLQGGSVLSSLDELHEALLAMSDEQYSYHTQDRNDFAAWVEHVLLDAEAASALHRARARNEAAQLLKETLSLYY